MQDGHKLRKGAQKWSKTRSRVPRHTVVVVLVVVIIVVIIIVIVVVVAAEGRNEKQKGACQKTCMFIYAAWGGLSAHPLQLCYTALSLTVWPNGTHHAGKQRTETTQDRSGGATLR